MNKEYLKSLTEELNNIEELSLDKLAELEIKYDVSEIIILKFRTEIKKFKLQVGENFNEEGFLLYLETSLDNARLDYEYYSSLVEALDFDNELLGTAIEALELSERNVKKYENILEIGEEYINLNNYQK